MTKQASFTWSLLLFILLSGTLSCLLSLALAAASSEPAQSVSLTIRVSNLSAAGETDILEMEKTAAAIFERSGIKLSWVDCSNPIPAIPESPACSQPTTGNTLLLSVVNDARQLGSHVLAWTTLNTSKVAVGYNRARMLAHVSTIGLSVGRILGHALAHELGHLLLETGAHDLFGIMKASYNSRDLFLMAQARLLFTPEESRLMRSHVRRVSAASRF